MSAALLWIGLPIIAAILMWFFRSRINLATGIAVGTCVLLMLLAIILPIGSKVNVGSISFVISPNFHRVLSRFWVTFSLRIVEDL